MAVHFSSNTLDLHPIEYDIVPAGRSPYGALYGIRTGGNLLSMRYDSYQRAQADAPGQVEFLVNFWAEKLALQDADDFSRVVDNVHYRALPAPEGHHGMLGYGGRQFWFQHHRTLEVTTSTNVWCQGNIPTWFQEYLPNTHHFVYPHKTMPGKFTRNYEESAQ